MTGLRRKRSCREPILPFQLTATRGSEKDGYCSGFSVSCRPFKKQTRKRETEKGSRRLRLLHGPREGKFRFASLAVHGVAGGMAGAGWAPPQLEDFILTERLGSGTYATVFKAYRKKNVREVVAIKCVSKKTLNKASVENLLTEIKILKTIHHPHIVELKYFQWDKDYIYLIMEFCAGGDLSRFIHARRILPEKVARIFLQQLGEE
ncbi:serine/threonine-protein kinase ULK3 [Rhineura floridana]|uniref:serine/threonine-protein kinase ULK3 n=1 Tax=Rhineura floridana TaxID=261503 RepID=UPI002AC8796C|nr:serine/threonine-protein kinase ULK3 [Rhineura floridana]